jgi:hypothetical protein
VLRSSPRVSAQILAPVAAPAPAAVVAQNQFHPSPPVVRSFMADSVEWQEPRRPRRVWAWLLAAVVLAGGGYVGMNEWRARQAAAAAPAADEATPTKAAEAAVAVAVPAAPADPLSAGFELPGIPVETRVVFDGKELGLGPMRVLKLTPGAHKLELIPPAGTPVQTIEVQLAADAVTPITVPAAAPVAVAEVAPAPEAAPAAEAPAAVEEKAEEKPVAKKAEKAEKAEKAADKPKKAVASRRGRSSDDGEDDDDDDEAEDDVPAKKPVKTPAPAAASKGMGTLLVNAKPPCEIIIDGKRTGLTTPQRSLELKPGAHTILLVNAENRIKKSSQVKVVAGKPTRLVVDLTDQMK